MSAEEQATDTPQQVDDDRLDPRLLDVLICPITRGPLRYDEARQELVSEMAGLAYPVRRGLPVMLPDEARRLTAEESATDKGVRPA